MPEKSCNVLETLCAKSGDHEFYTEKPLNYKSGRTKYIVVTGSVISGVGKGTFTSSLASVLHLYHGLKVSPIKFDGYLNCDAGTLNPYRHGEVFVLDDGTECDLDLGSYERMLNINLTRGNYITAGKIFKSIIDKERAGKYLGRDVQFIPHVTGEIKGFIRKLAVDTNADVVIVEVGGTVGDIENSYFMEAMRELAYEEGKSNVCFVNVVYILEPGSLGEQKSKAAQLGIKMLMAIGIQPDMVVCRGEHPIKEKVMEKISVYSNVPMERIVNSFDAKNILEIPLFLVKNGVDKAVLAILGIESRHGNDNDFRHWESIVEKIDGAKKEIRIGITGKYTEVHDAYISILKALEHTAPYFGARVFVDWIETSDINAQNVAVRLKGMDGIIVPGGFGSRGTEGKIECIRHARENKLPYFGLCYGFQMAVIEFARNVCGLKGANSTEIDPQTKEPVIDILPEQKKIEALGGTMRLGGRDVEVRKGTLAHKLYGKDSVRERFRHRYEVNPDYIKRLEGNGMIFSGRAPNQPIMQILELAGHPFFVGVQFHPEFTSKPLEPNPLFRGFIEACIKNKVI